MSIETVFDECLNEWGRHTDSVVHLSNPEKYVQCEAYRRLANMGSGIFPFIRRELSTKAKDDKIPWFAWAFIIREIANKEFNPPDRIQGRPREMLDYTRRFLDDYLKTHSS